MNYSFTNTESHSFTVTHAKYIASKVATDLKRIQRFYNQPTDRWIEDYELELIEHLRNGYLKAVTYGFQKDGKWIEPTLIYTARELAGLSATDDDPGRIRPGANVEGAHFTSYLITNSKYHGIAESERSTFNKLLPFQRTGSIEPGISGYLIADKTYSSGGRALERSLVKTY
jgi:hypothetical protein